jgi:DNA-binding beta-propeller fold protein YncE
VTAAPPGRLAGPGTDPEAVIREARRRQHRRWLAVAVAAAVVIAGVTAVVAGSGAGSRPRPPGHQVLPGPGHGRPVAPARPAAEAVTVSQTRVPRAIGGLAAGYGAVWLTGGGVTYQVDQVTGEIVRTIPTPTPHPFGYYLCVGSSIAAGAGAVWVTHGCRGIYRIDPRSGRVTGSLRAPGRIDAIAAAGGLIWVIGGNGGLSRIQPRTGQVIGNPIRVGSGGWQLTPGADTLWVTSYGSGPSSNTVYRVDLATGAVKRLANPTVTDVQAVGAGSLWTSQVERVDPVTGRTTGSDFLNTFGVAFWKGSAWVLTWQRSFTLLRIDAATNRVIGKPVPVGRPVPGGWADASMTPIVAGPTGLWILDPYPYRPLLYHVTMRPARA